MVLGLIVLLIMTRNERLGLISSISLIAVGSAIFYKRIEVNKPPPVLIPIDVTIEWVWIITKFN